MGKLIKGDNNMRRKKKQNRIERILNNKYTYVFIVFFLIIMSYLTVTNKINIEKYFRDVIFYPTKFIDTKPFIEDVNSEMQKENEDLKRLLNIKDSLADYEVIYATTIVRNNSYWLNNITINKGESSGIKVGMAVVDYNGLIGYIEKTSMETSLVKLITSNDKYNTASVKIVGHDEVNKILKVSNNKLIIEGINKSSNIQVGDKVITNGLSDKFPSGITIGEISSINNDFYNVSNIATVKLHSNVENIRFVAVLKRNI